ncbi:hypothetical protein HRbin24_01470 [bacterium HR24]|nr:hypothetical protein HRbin24_01470 [bacterium HR24]
MHGPEHFERQRGLASIRGAVTLAALMVLGALLLAAGVRAATGGQRPPAPPEPPARGVAPAGGAPAARATATQDDGTPSLAPPATSAPDSARAPAVTPGSRPAPVLTPGPGRPSLDVATPPPSDPRATVRSARAGQPRQQRPLSEPGPLARVPGAVGATAGESLSLPMPVPGRWQVTCGYRCGLHDGLHTYGLDLVRLDGPTAGTPVRAPVAGRIVAVVDGTVAYCGGRWVTGIAAGSVVVLEFPLADGQIAHLRLIHLDAGTVPASLRPRDGPLAVAAGTYLGSLAYIGPGCAHLHLDVALVDAGEEVPVPLSLGGRYLPDCGRDECWTGTVLP